MREFCLDFSNITKTKAQQYTHAQKYKNGIAQHRRKIVFTHTREGKIGVENTY
jgi:hypothetical protein